MNTVLIPFFFFFSVLIFMFVHFAYSSWMDMIKKTVVSKVQYKREIHRTNVTYFFVSVIILICILYVFFYVKIPT